MFIHDSSEIPKLMRNSNMGRIMQALVSEIPADPDLASVYRERVIRRRFADVRTWSNAASPEGVLRPDLDPENVTDLLPGPSTTGSSLVARPWTTILASAS
jgi:hypothetical protein